MKPAAIVAVRTIVNMREITRRAPSETAINAASAYAKMENDTLHNARR